MHVAVDVNACNICIDMDEQVMGEGWGVGDDDDGGDEIVVWSATGCEWLRSVMLARMFPNICVVYSVTARKNF